MADGNPMNATDHRRAYYIINTPHLGYVGMAIIGMYDISSIHLIKNTGDTVKRDEELGHFAYGGSEIVLLFQKNKALLNNISRSPTGSKKLGKIIGHTNKVANI